MAGFALVLCKHLHASDPRISVAAATQILDRTYDQPVQSIDANISEDGGPVGYYAEVPKKAESAEAWLQSLASGGDGKSAQDVNPREPASTDAVQALMPLNVRGQQLR